MVVDACVWISLHLAHDRYHQATDRWFRRVERQRTPMVAPVILLAEVSGAVSRRTGDSPGAQALVQAMSRLSTLSLLPVDRELGDIAARLAADLRLRGADACYVAVAQTLDLPLVTWDEELRERAQRVVAAVEPE
ncbi:MAG: type II toxin-antitoxin system VapC family toxin [Anaerolineae bacterium]|nr:type II toxin-antitoxin system VapC family toxin [Anaerolineae bacterium]